MWGSSFFLIPSNKRVGSLFKVFCCQKRENPRVCISLFWILDVTWLLVLQNGVSELFEMGQARVEFCRSPADC